MMRENTNWIKSSPLGNPVTLTTIVFSAILLAAATLTAIINYPSLPAEIPIFYSVADQVLAGKKFLFLMPATIFTTLAVNLAVIKVFLIKRPFLAQVLIITQVLVAFLVFWSELKIILLF